MSNFGPAALTAQEAPGLPWLNTQPATGDLPDINVWLALAVQEHPHHTLAHRYWADEVAPLAADGQAHAWFCRTTMLGLVRLLCQPKAVGSGALDLAGAWRLYQSWRAQPLIGLLPDPSRVDGEIDRLLKSVQPAARLWTDTYLAALAYSSGLRLVTFDRDFERFGLARCRILALA